MRAGLFFESLVLVCLGKRGVIVSVRQAALPCPDRVTPAQAYANTGFSQKNPQKYLKYEPADVEGMLKGFFSASGL